MSLWNHNDKLVLFGLPSCLINSIFKCQGPVWHNVFSTALDWEVIYEWITQQRKVDLGSCPHQVVCFSPSYASFSISSISNFQVGCFHKYRDVSWRSQLSNWSQAIPRHPILEKSVTWIVICSPFFLAICFSLLLTTTRLSICNNRCIFNTFVSIPSTPYFQAFSLPKDKKKEGLLPTSLSKDHTLLYWALRGCLPSATWQKRPFKMCDIICSEVMLLTLSLPSSVNVPVLLHFISAM